MNAHVLDDPQPLGVERRFLVEIQGPPLPPLCTIARGQGRQEGADGALAWNPGERGMKMACPRLALWVLARAEAPGARAALIGDVLEEIAGGRSRWWIWRQAIGLCGFALVARVRGQARVTPQLVTLVLGVLLLGGISFAPPGRVIETWAGVYLFAGLLSLFADVTWRTTHSRMLLIWVDPEEAGRPGGI